MAPDVILESWQANADAWIQTIAAQEIESRKLVTNAAIVAILEQWAAPPLLDLGCGEGWLARTMGTKGWAVTGTDGVEALVQHARSLGNEVYEQYSYEEFINLSASARVGKHQSVVINFALLDKENTEQLLATLHHYLLPQGRLFIQTLHPMQAGGTAPYTDGWRDGSWGPMARPFVQPYAWYYRTMAGWVSLLHHSGYQLVHMAEPLHPHTKMPASLILVAVYVGTQNPRIVE